MRLRVRPSWAPKTVLYYQDEQAFFLLDDVLLQANAPQQVRMTGRILKVQEWRLTPDRTQATSLTWVRLVVAYARLLYWGHRPRLCW